MMSNWMGWWTDEQISLKKSLKKELKGIPINTIVKIVRDAINLQYKAILKRLEMKFLWRRQSPIRYSRQFRFIVDRPWILWRFLFSPKTFWSRIKLFKKIYSMSSGRKLLKKIQHSHVDPFVLWREFNCRTKEYWIQEAVKSIKIQSWSQLKWIMKEYEWMVYPRICSIAILGGNICSIATCNW
jgi:hypothetical protein